MVGELGAFKPRQGPAGPGKGEILPCRGNHIALLRPDALEQNPVQPQWEEVLGRQLDEGLAGVDKSKVVIGYEPVWSIGPGKTPAGKDYITMIARFVKERTGGMDVVYGGGLKTDNAEMLASIDEIDGGLIALTRFAGEIGWDPDEYLEIIRTYLGK